MALRQILAKRQQVVNAAGQPLAGGRVYLYEPNTTSFITSYRDSGLVTAHTNPIRLSGSGRAEIWVSRDCDVRIEDRNGNLITEELNANPDTLGADDIGGLVPNGSFETDADADGVPDGWTLTDEIGSNNAIDDSESTDGAQSFRFTSTGDGGGSLETTDFFPVNDTQDLRVDVDLRSTVAGVQNIIRVKWYDSSQVAISSEDLYDSTNNPTTFTTEQLLGTPPDNARFAKLELIGCDPNTSTAGSTWMDRVQVYYPLLVTGVFDNVTIQDNEIVTTNTNGDLTLAPDGTGKVIVEGTLEVETPSGALDGVLIRATAPRLTLIETNADEDEGAYGFTADAGQLRLRALEDDGTGAVEILTVDRTGTNVDAIALAADALTWNGETLFTVDNDGAGSGLDADLLDGLHANAFAQLAAANTFTDGGSRDSAALQVRSSSGIAELYLRSGSASTDEKGWSVSALDTGDFRIASGTDADGFGENCIQIERTGTNIDSISIDADVIELNGVDVSDYARLSQANEFTASGVGSSSAVLLNSDTPSITFRDSGESSGDKVWNWTARNSGGTAGLELQLRDDAYSLGDVAVRFARNGTSLSFADFPNGQLRYGGVEVGFRGMLVNEQNGNYTTDEDDSHGLIYKDSGGSGETITIDGSDYSAGAVLSFVNNGGGSLTIAMSDDTLHQAGTGSTGSRTLADHGMATAVKVDSSNWFISGVGLS